MADTTMPERAEEADRAQVARREPRTDANLTAVIRLPDGTELRCIVKDVSKSGARLGLPRGCVLPETFMFKVNGRDFVFLAKLAWQREHYAGVSIARIAKLPAGPAPSEPGTASRASGTNPARA